ncbi:M48 family metallopeptidase [Devosia rhizoryzae]|uniref:M48 family metallopeptidase n=1 Tax=Devosia rhizoryzae TaxID=2774137 RepID=A0ABX7C6S8_9HYPH|nr:M48 family metallopeptidase [Devosia rhizoryzae]QQR39916.1 M48 family metallopeptidase [Devosia rhizoryzae]
MLNSKLFLVVSTLVLPLLVVALGLWETGRGTEYRDFVVGERSALKAQLVEMEALPPPEFGGINMGMRYQADGNTYVGEFALDKMREAIGGFDLALAVAEYRQVLPPVVIASGGAAFLIGLGVILVSGMLAAVGARTRPGLLHGFSVVRRILPGALIGLVVITALAAVSIVLFEVAPLVRLDRLGRGQAYVLAIAAALVALALVTAWQALAQLRRFSLLFEPEAYPLIAQAVDRDVAPGLWRLVESFAQRLGAPVPDTIAVGLAQGFFVVSGPVKLLPDEQTVTGNTLHVPLGHLVFMQLDEAATVIGHELAHFAGEDTAYSQKFLPIYNGFGRSLDAVAAAGRARDGSLSFLTAPALALGYFVSDRFHLAVQHWSRIRELEADAKSATLTSQDAAGRALLRHSAVAGVIDDVVAYAWANPDRVPEDIVPFLLEAAGERGLDDPTPLLAQAIVHPTDSHPHSRDRLAAFGFSLDPQRVAAAVALPEDGHKRLASYFADPVAVSRLVTAGLVGASHRASTEHREALTATASAVGEEAVALYENTKPIAIMMFVIAVPMLALAAWTLAFGLPGFGSESIILTVAFGLCGGFILLLGLQAVQRSRTPFMWLYPDRVEHRHLDRPIMWSEVRNYSAVNASGTMVTTFLLKRSAKFPKCVGFGGRGRIILNPGAWVVTIRSVPPQKLKAKGYIELIDRYAQAAAAREALATAPAELSPTQE